MLLIFISSEQGVNGLQVKYAIDDGVLATILQREYGIQLDGLLFIPMGDSAYSYRVNGTNGDRYYLKLFDHQNDRQRRSVERLKYYLPLTWQIYHQGLFRKTACPILNCNGEFQTTFNDLTIVLFNFIEGETLADEYPFSQQILKEIAQAVAAIHQATSYIDPAQVLIESFDISFECDLEKCVSTLEKNSLSENYIIQALREQVLSKKEQIFFLLELVRKLRGIAIADHKDKVLCHGDVWGGNLIRQDHEIYFIDWESAIIAPPEFDLFGYIGEGFDVFFSSYEKHLGHPVTLNLDLLRFYSYRHHLRNLTDWIMNILYRNHDEKQNQNDLEMILHHCMNRWDHIERNVRSAGVILGRKSVYGN
jgi:spectinomycin phosphotransferase